MDEVIGLSIIKIIPYDGNTPEEGFYVSISRHLQ
jgi:hypothetical protein